MAPWCLESNFKADGLPVQAVWVHVDGTVVRVCCKVRVRDLLPCFVCNGVTLLTFLFSGFGVGLCFGSVVVVLFCVPSSWWSPSWSLFRIPSTPAKFLVRGALVVFTEMHAV